MFEQMVLLKNSSLIPKYYHKDFKLYTNGQEMDYQSFLDQHTELYNTPISYSIKYDEKTLMETKDRVSARVWITVKKPGKPPIEIEVILISTYVQEKIHRLWELTWPDWSTIDHFKSET